MTIRPIDPLSLALLNAQGTRRKDCVERVRILARKVEIWSQKNIGWKFIGVIVVSGVIGVSAGLTWCLGTLIASYVANKVFKAFYPPEELSDDRKAFQYTIESMFRRGSFGLRTANALIDAYARASGEREVFSRILHGIQEEAELSETLVWKIERIFVRSKSVLERSEYPSAPHHLPRQVLEAFANAIDVLREDHSLFTEEIEREIYGIFFDAAGNRLLFLRSLQEMVSQGHLLERDIPQIRRTFDQVMRQRAADGLDFEGHDPNIWLEHFGISNNQSRARMRREVFDQTLHAFSNGYLLPDGRTETIPQREIQEMQRSVRVLSCAANNYTIDDLPTRESQATVEVINSDCLDVAIWLKSQGANPALLNMANADSPGGGVRDGVAAQEEHICRSSNLFLGLDPQSNPNLERALPEGNYHIPEFGAIYLNGVHIIRGNETEGYPFEAPERIGVISAAAYQMGVTSPSDLQIYDQNMKQKIREVLRIAAYKGHDSVVLGAWGCGAFRNPSSRVANLFKEVLQEREFQSKFARIVFAVIDDHNGQNFVPFHRTLHGMRV